MERGTSDGLLVCSSEMERVIEGCEGEIVWTGTEGERERVHIRHTTRHAHINNCMEVDLFTQPTAVV